MLRIELLLAALLVTGFGAGSVSAQDAEHADHKSQAAAEATTPATQQPDMPCPEMGRSRGGWNMMMGQNRGLMHQCMEMMVDIAHGERDMMHHRPGAMRDMDMMDMDGGDMAVAAPDDPVEGAFAAIDRRMHHDMAMQVDGTPDVIFAEAMVPHHQGAIDMAKVILGFGKDPEIRKLAEDIIAAQKKKLHSCDSDWLSNPQSEHCLCNGRHLAGTHPARTGSRSEGCRCAARHPPATAPTVVEGPPFIPRQGHGRKPRSGWVLTLKLA